MPLLCQQSSNPKARHFWAHSSECGLAICFCCIQCGCWTIVDVRPVCNCDGCLCCEQQLWASGYALRTNTLTDSHPVVISCVSVKISTVSILTWTSRPSGVPSAIFTWIIFFFDAPC